jgi:hypothetical protein
MIASVSSMSHTAAPPFSSHTCAIADAHTSAHITTAKSAEQAAKAVSAETTSAKKAAVTAPVPFSSEDYVQEGISAPVPSAPAQASAPVAATEQFSNDGASHLNI